MFLSGISEQEKKSFLRLIRMQGVHSSKKTTQHTNLRVAQHHLEPCLQCGRRQYSFFYYTCREFYAICFFAQGNTTSPRTFRDDLFRYYSADVWRVQPETTQQKVRWRGQIAKRPGDGHNRKRNVVRDLNKVPILEDLDVDACQIGRGSSDSLNFFFVCKRVENWKFKISKIWNLKTQRKFPPTNQESIYLSSSGV